jgi:hypothetical protein
MRIGRNTGLNGNGFRTGMEKISLAGMSMSEKAGSQESLPAFSSMAQSEIEPNLRTFL